MKQTMPNNVIKLKNIHYSVTDINMNIFGIGLHQQCHISNSLSQHYALSKFYTQFMALKLNEWVGLLVTQLTVDNHA